MQVRKLVVIAGLAGALLGERVAAQDATVVKAGEGPQLVMTAPELKTYEERAKRKVSAARKAGLAAAASPRVRNPEIVNLTTPPANEPTESAENVNTANRWCRARGYEWGCGRGDLVRMWFEECGRGNCKDPATLFADWGFDSPAVDCDFTYTFPMPPEMPDQPVITLTRNGIAYSFDARRCIRGSSCAFTITIPCINEKLPPTWALHPGVVKCAQAGVGEVPCTP